MTTRGERTNPGSWELWYALRLHPDRWAHLDEPGPTRALATVVGGWALLAWARFGLPGLAAPRPVLRFLLVGVYVWLLLAALAAATGLAAARLGRRGPVPGPERALQITGSAHLPLVVFGAGLLVGQVLWVPSLLTALAVATLGIWLPGMLVAAMAEAFGRADRWSVGTALVLYGCWAGLAGRYLFDRVGHLF